MNKKLFLGMFAAAGMLLATSCSNDELDVVQSGNEAQVTFSLAAEGGIATRAISDGKTANKLVYAVFDSEGKPLSVLMWIMMVFMNIKRQKPFQISHQLLTK